MKYPFHSRSCPVQPVPISVVGTKMESGWGKWGYRPQTMMLSFFFSSLLHFDSLPDTFFVFWTQEYIWVRTRPRSTGIWVQLASPSLPPSVTRCGVEVGQSGTGELKDGGEGCCSLWRGYLLICCSITHFHLLFTWIGFRTTTIFSGTQFSYLSDTLIPSEIFFIKVSTEGDLDSINR